MDTLSRAERLAKLRFKLRTVIFGVDTPLGKGFDLALLGAILLSVTVVVLESVPGVRKDYGHALRIAEWCFTGLFTIEYVLRIWIASRRRRYVTSFFGLIDLLAILPTYLSALIPGTQSLQVVRGIRLIRVFRVLKFVRHLREAHALARALKASRPKIVVFLTAVISVAVIFGTVMYLVEGDDAGFTSIPTGIYWAVVTMTTVGYGDIAPQTPFGQFLALCLMVLGYAIIAVPTGIVSAELTRSGSRVRVCPHCSRRSRDRGARYCGGCGKRLRPMRQRIVV